MRRSDSANPKITFPIQGTPTPAPSIISEATNTQGGDSVSIKSDEFRGQTIQLNSEKTITKLSLWFKDEGAESQNLNVTICEGSCNGSQL